MRVEEKRNGRRRDWESRLGFFRDFFAKYLICLLCWFLFGIIFLRPFFHGRTLQGPKIFLFFFTHLLQNNVVTKSIVERRNIKFYISLVLQHIWERNTSSSMKRTKTHYHKNILGSKTTL